MRRRRLLVPCSRGELEPWTVTNILSGILPLFEVDPCASQLVMLAAISGDTLDFCG
jgi:hypothetical protein